MGRHRTSHLGIPGRRETVAARKTAETAGTRTVLIDIGGNRSTNRMNTMTNNRAPEGTSLTHPLAANSIVGLKAGLAGPSGHTVTEIGHNPQCSHMTLSVFASLPVSQFCT